MIPFYADLRIGEAVALDADDVRLSARKPEPAPPDQARPARRDRALRAARQAEMMGKTPGRGSAYLVTRRDEDGDWLDGGHAYRLHVPANPPMRPFWAITLYEGDTRTLLQNETQSPERGSNSQGLQMNADGSVDLYFGPTPPPGKETNWVQTVPERFWFAYFRLYAPTEAYIDRSWPLPDIEKAD